MSSKNALREAASFLKKFETILSLEAQIEELGSIENVIAARKREAAELEKQNAGALEAAQAKIADAEKQAQAILDKAAAALVEAEREKGRGVELRERGQAKFNDLAREGQDKRSELIDEGRRQAAEIVAGQNAAVAKRDKALADAAAAEAQIRQAKEQFDAYVASREAIKGVAP